jgi:hypothetical protein
MEACQSLTAPKDSPVMILKAICSMQRTLEAHYGSDCFRLHALPNGRRRFSQYIKNNVTPDMMEEMSKKAYAVL